MSSRPLLEAEETRRTLADLYAPIARRAGRGRADLPARAAAAGSRSCNTWSTTAPISRASGFGRRSCCCRAGPAARSRAAHPVLAAVVEMIHTATLVHDDVLDEAMVRRHAATVNAEWGNETAVLLGDYLFTHAFHLAASLESTLRLPLDRPRDQQGLRGRDAAGPPSRQPRPRRGDLLRDHRGQDGRADGRLLPPGRRTTPGPPRRPSRRSTATAATWASPSRSPTTCSISGARSGSPARAWAPTWRSRS